MTGADWWELLLAAWPLYLVALFAVALLLWFRER